MITYNNSSNNYCASIVRGRCKLKNLRRRINY